MSRKLHQHFTTAVKAALFAFSRSSRNGESLREILGYIDTLSGIPNRKAFEEDRKNITPFQAFVLIDIDNLKQLNDTFGHLFGDQIVISCARVLEKATEKVGSAYRIGGDEFALIVPHCWVKTVCLCIKNHVKEDPRFSISMGIAPPGDVTGLTDEVFKTAETALYQSKHRQSDIYEKFLTEEIEELSAPVDFYSHDVSIENSVTTTA